MKIKTDSYENRFKDYLFYDIEVFEKDILIVFKDINAMDVKVFHNDFTGLRDLIQDKILVGYNNYNYDDYIISAVLRGYSLTRIKDINDTIIRGDRPQIELDKDIVSLDCFQQINVARSSLKKVEANLGMSIDESEVPFDIKRELTKEEYDSVLKYCKHDVEATVNVFKLRWFTYFVPKISVVEMLPAYLQDKAIRWNTTTITAQLLTDGEPIERWFNYKWIGAENLERVKKLLPKKVFKMWSDNKKKIRVPELGKMEETKVEVDVFDCTFVFGFGGLHAVRNNGKVYTNVKLLDVASMYPNIILQLNALGNRATAKYREIVEKRLHAKHNNDSATADALKLVINSTYGLMRNEYSKLYNPIGATSVNIFSQLSLFDLCSRLYDSGYKIVNVNTDGVGFCGTGSRPFTEIQKEWEEDYNLTLELSEYTKWVQKDVNNYIARDKRGYIKVKGGDVKKFNDPNEYRGNLFELNAGVTWTSTNSIPIIDRAVVDYVLEGTPPEITIDNNKSHPLLFQFVLQAGRTFEGTFDMDGKQYQKVNRVFASKEGGVNLYKLHQDGRKVKFANTPIYVHVYNDDLRMFYDFEDKVDLKYYMELAQKACERWTDDSTTAPFTQFL